jgi:hypothetical protein
MRPRRHHQCCVCPHHPQKNALYLWQRKQWVIPPQANADLVCTMENVREVYTRPYDPQRPQVCVDDMSTPRVVTRAYRYAPRQGGRRVSMTRMHGRAQRIG